MDNRKIIGNHRYWAFLTGPVFTAFLGLVAIHMKLSLFLPAGAFTIAIALFAVFWRSGCVVTTEGVTLRGAFGIRTFALEEVSHFEPNAVKRQIDLVLTDGTKMGTGLQYGIGFGAIFGLPGQINRELSEAKDIAKH